LNFFFFQTMSSAPLGKDKIFIKDLMVQAILGVNKKERVKRQNININITLFHDIKQAALHDDVRGTINYSHVCKSVVAYTEDSHHHTIESLCSGIARICCLNFGAEEVTVHVEKPCALSLARCPAVEIHRSRDFFLRQEPVLLDEERKLLAQQQQQQHQESGEGDLHTAHLALGSNLGQRKDNIHKALELLRQSCDVISTSALYEVRRRRSLGPCSPPTHAQAGVRACLRFVGLHSSRLLLPMCWTSRSS